MQQSFAEYKNKFSSKTRSTLNRKIKKYTEYCDGRISWKIYKSAEEMPEFFKCARTLDGGRVGLITIHNHPQTGKPFKQLEVSLWREAIETTLHAHQYFPDCRVLRWDVALTPGGPIIS